MYILVSVELQYTLVCAISAGGLGNICGGVKQYKDLNVESMMFIVGLKVCEYTSDLNEI